MKTKISNKAVKMAENIKNCCQGLITKYEEYMQQHSEPSIEQTTLARLENNYQDLQACLSTTLTTVIKPCSIIDLEIYIISEIDKFYDMIIAEIDSIDVMKFKRQKHFEDAKNSMAQTGRIINAVEQLDVTCKHHLRARPELLPPDFKLEDEPSES